MPRQQHPRRQSSGEPRTSIATLSAPTEAPEQQSTEPNTSRIFLRNLPPTITEADFAAHLHRYRGDAITDVRLLPRRRIAYVGYKTSDDARAAIKYFNKSFIRMSRIMVEPARDMERDGNVTVVAPTARKDNPPAVAQKSVDPAKLEEYLELTKGKNASKRSWQDAVQVGQTVPDDLRQDLDTSREPLQKKAKVSVSEAAPAKEATVSEPLVNNAAEDSEPSKSEDRSLDSEPAPRDIAAGEPPRSDADWMRSRTSRLLGLLDEDEEEQNAIAGAGDRRSVEKFPAEHAGLEVPKQQVTPHVEPGKGNDEASGQSEKTTATNSDEGVIHQSSRLFLRKLSYNVVDKDLDALFGSLGSLEEVHVPVDPKTGKAKGIAFVQFEKPEDAVAAWRKLDGQTFQGRLLHVLPGAAKREDRMSEYEISKLPLKQQRQLQRRSTASSSTVNWNSLFMNADAVVSSIAARLGVAKSDVIDPTSSDASVKQAQAETQVILETKKYLESSGVDLDSFAEKEREDNPILVKNFPYGTTVDELQTTFSEFGAVHSVLMPPTGTLAIVEFSQKNDAKAAFKGLAYRRFKESILYLEKAPRNLFKADRPAGPVPAENTPAVVSPQPAAADLLRKADEEEALVTSTLFVRNLNFATSTAKFQETFRSLDGFTSATVMTKKDPKKPGQTLSMGYGFLEFRSRKQAQAALAAMNGFTLDGHRLEIRASHKGGDAGEERKREESSRRQQQRKSKIIIKNLPFQATKQDVRSLFGSYGQLRSVRVPKKFDNSRKGFAFAEFTTPREAENAMEALRNTHLLGRRLVLDYAAGDAEDPEAEIERMQQKIGKQSNSVALQRLTAASERKKFLLRGDEEQ